LSRVLLAWELGGNLGHVVALLGLARGLRERGHQVLFAMRDLSNAAMLAREGFSFVPAPSPWHQRKPTLYPSYVAMLEGEVFPSANATLVAALAWRSIMRAAGAELVVADHAPVAMLAARALKLRTAAFGVPFSIPIAGQDLPVFADKHASQVEEQRLLKRLNSVLTALGAPSMERASDLYRADATMVRCLPEVDCFGPRSDDAYAMMPAGDAGDAIPEWPKADGPRALVYLKAGPDVKPVLQALASSGLSTIAYIGGLARRDTPLKRPGMLVTNTLFKSSALTPQADLVICNRNAGTVTGALLAGKPVLMLPQYMEQALTARRVVDAGAGAVPEKRTAGAIARSFEAMRPGTAAAVAASRLGRHAPAKLEHIVQRVESVLHA